MGRFDHVAALAIGDKTSSYTVYEIQGHPVLKLAHAGQSNSPYFNARLALAAKNVRGGSRSKATADIMAKDIAHDRELYPKHVLRGWENVFDTNGSPVPFSTEAAAEFIDALPPDIFEGVRSHASDPGNYRDAPADPTELAGNSESD
jgi:hypothetical protein